MPIQYLFIFFLLRAPGLDVNTAVERDLRPLHYAAYVDNSEAVQLLIYHGADPNIPDEVSKTKGN